MCTRQNRLIIRFATLASSLSLPSRHRRASEGPVSSAKRGAEAVGAPFERRRLPNKHHDVQANPRSYALYPNPQALILRTVEEHYSAVAR